MNRLAQFPLQLVIFPQEKLNLHVFEPRYRSLIRKCLEEEVTFGITPYINGQLASIGTEVKLTTVHRKYEDGRMDISCLGLRPYKLIEFDAVHPDKGYSEALVEFMDVNEEGDIVKKSKVHALLEKVLQLIRKEEKVIVDVNDIHTSRVIHKLGLSLEQEVEILGQSSENDRLEILIKQLRRIIPAIKQAEEIRQRVEMNGHFKNLGPLDI